MQLPAGLLIVLACLGTAVAQPFLQGATPGLMPTGNLRTTDQGGPYNFTFLGLQVADVKGAAIRPATH